MPGTAIAGWPGCAPEKAGADVAAEVAPAATLAEGEGSSADHDVVERNAVAPDTALPRGTAAEGLLVAVPAGDCAAQLRIAGTESAVPFAVLETSSVFGVPAAVIVAGGDAVGELCHERYELKSPLAAGPANSGPASGDPAD